MSLFVRCICLPVCPAPPHNQGREKSTGAPGEVVEGKNMSVHMVSVSYSNFILIILLKKQLSRACSFQISGNDKYMPKQEYSTPKLCL